MINSTANSDNKTISPENFDGLLSDIAAFPEWDDPEMRDALLETLQVVISRRNQVWEYEPYEPYEPEDSYHLCDFCAEVTQ